MHLDDLGMHMFVAHVWLQTFARKEILDEKRCQTNIPRTCLLVNTFSLSISLLANVSSQTFATYICVSEYTFKH